MSKKKNKRSNDDCALDMTPMIDVVFQLIIFFVVTLKTADNINPEIVLEYGKDGPKIEQKENQLPSMVIEIKRYRTPSSFFRRSGTIISLSGAITSEGQLRTLLQKQVKKFGTNFPLLIRADKETPHEDVRRVMNICSSVGVWKIQFVAMIKPGDDGMKKH
ncbi:MAG: biopolymer transporter ExbD [Kiritimatiellia bacterium]